MAPLTDYMIDKSVLARMQVPAVRARVQPIIESGGALTCAIVDLEVLFSARNHAEHQRIRERRSLAYRDVPIEQRFFERAKDIQSELAKTGRHRVPIPDLLIAAAAESVGAVVLHYDQDFDLISEITAQPVAWVVPRGSVP